MRGVADWVERHAARRPPFVGSSLGGFYATHLAERFGARAAMINPAVRPYVDLAPSLGVQTNLYTGEAFDVDAAHFDELRGWPWRASPGLSATSCSSRRATKCSTIATPSRSTAARRHTFAAAATIRSPISRMQIPAILRFAGGADAR